MKPELKARKRKSTGIIPLTDYAAHHHELHASMTRVSMQIGMNVPNKRQLVIALLDSIDRTHPDISAHILTIKSDTRGLRSDFEPALSHLIKADPV